MYKTISATEAKSKLLDVRRAIESYLKLVGEENDNVTWNRKDPEENFIQAELYKISRELEDTLESVQYLEKDIIAEGELYLNSQGRYEINDDVYFTSGSRCEILLYDEDEETHYWRRTTIEHNGEDYYATALGREASIEGIKARARKSRYSY